MPSKRGPVLPPEAMPQRRKGGRVTGGHRQGVGQVPIVALVPQNLQDRVLVAIEQISGGAESVFANAAGS